MEECKIGNEKVKIYGIAKGSGMIHPNMATTLSYVFTDATLSTRPLVDWSWSFGDGTFSNSQNPIHNYSNTGVFDFFIRYT